MTVVDVAIDLQMMERKTFSIGANFGSMPNQS